MNKTRFIYRFDLKGTIADALASISKELSKSAIEYQLKERLSDLLINLAKGAVGACVGAFALSLLNGILKRQDVIARELQALSREPFNTGCRVAYEAINLPSGSEEEVKYREHRIRMAQNHLDSALTLCITSSTAQEDILLIKLLLALCAYQIPGGETDARNHANEIILYLNQDISHLENQLKDMRKTAELKRAEANRFGSYARLRKSKYEVWPSDRILSQAFRKIKEADNFEDEIKIIEQEYNTFSDFLALLQYF